MGLAKPQRVARDQGRAELPISQWDFGLPSVAVVDEDVQGKMAPSKVEGIILGFELEKERKSRERQENESVE